MWVRQSILQNFIIIIININVSQLKIESILWLAKLVEILNELYMF